MMAHVREDSIGMLSALPISDSELGCGNPGLGKVAGEIGVN